MRIKTSRAVSLLSICFMAACASVGGGGDTDTGPSYPQVAGEWSGSITVAGEQIPSTLSITQAGADLQLVTRIPALELNTQGQGTVLPDGGMRGSFSYNLECPGEAELVGSLSSDGTTLGGTLLASDCTGDLEGTFRYRR